MNLLLCQYIFADALVYTEIVHLGERKAKQ